MIACGDVEAGGERQLKTLAVVEFVVIDEAVVQNGGGGGDGGADTADTAAKDHLADAAYVGAGIALTNTAIGATVVVEVFEDAAAISANDGAIVSSARSIMGVEDHTVLNSSIIGFADE